MQVERNANSANCVQTDTDLASLIKSLEEKCKSCKPLSAITCVSDCKTWRLKHQIRVLHERIQKPDFLEHLLNTLKNRRRLQILKMTNRQHRSITQLQEKLKSLGHSHSQQTILEEYMTPMIEVGLVQQSQNLYTTTLLGSKVNDLVAGFQDLEEILPSHSECYEETVLEGLLEAPRTHEEARRIIPTNSVARVLSRLAKADLIQAGKEKNYVFFFKTKRDYHLSSLSETEKRVYDDIPEDGISAKKLSKKANISLRRTYKYLRKLKGKKLVFERIKPLRYSLTERGRKMAEMLRALRKLSAETQIATSQFLQNDNNGHHQMETVTDLAENNKHLAA
jgi:predicted transcriptional regulator